MGSQLLSYLQLGQETSKGTAHAATRRYATGLDGAYNVDFMNLYGEDRAPGRRAPISDAVSAGTMVTINYQTGEQGVAFNELQTFTQFPDGGTATGGTAFTWTHSYGGTAAGSYVTYTAEFGDNVQEYRAEYIFVPAWKVSAAVGGMTQLTATMIGRQSTKNTKTSLNYSGATRIPTYLWQWKHASSQSGLSGASFTTGAVKAFDLDVTQTGLVAGKYLDGTPYFTQSIETLPIQASLHLVVTHTSANVTEIYDKAAAQTVSFCELTATGPNVPTTSTPYSADFQVAVIYDNPTFTFIDGESCIDVTARVVYDDTWGKALQCTTVNDRNTVI